MSEQAQTPIEEKAIMVEPPVSAKQEVEEDEDAEDDVFDYFKQAPSNAASSSTRVNEEPV